MKFKLYIVLCIWMLMLLVTIMGASADITDLNNGVIFAYNGDYSGSILIDSMNTSNATIVGSCAINTSVGIRGQNAYSCQNAASGSGIDTNYKNTTTEDFTYSTWITCNNDPTAEYYVFGAWWSSTNKLQFAFQNPSNGKIEDGSERNNVADAISTSDVCDGSVHHIVLVSVKNGDHHLYVDGSSYSSSTNSNNDMTMGSWSVCIGCAQSGSGSYVNTPLATYELSTYWNRGLNSTEVSYLYNSSNGVTIPVSAGGSPPTTFWDVSSDYFGVVINSFNITLGNGSVYSTTNGTINTGINQSEGLVVNFTARGENEHYIPESFNDFNTSVDVQVNFSRYPILDVLSNWSVAGLSDWNVTINGSTYFDDSGLAYIRDVGFVGETSEVRKSGYVPLNFSLTTTIDSVNNVSIYQSVLEVRAFEKVTGSLLDNWTLVTGNGNFSNVAGVVTLYPDWATYNTWDFLFGGGYYNVSNVEVVVDEFEEFFNLSGVYDRVVTLKFLNFSSNLPVYNLSGLVNTSSFSEVFSGESNVSLNLSSGLFYDFEVNGSVDYVSDHQSNFLRGVNITSNSLLNVSLFRDESLVISFKDILTAQYVEGLDLLLLGISTYIFNTSNTSDQGFAYFVGLDVGSYDLLANKSGYTDFSASTSISNGVLTNVSGSVTGSSQEVTLFVRNVYDQYLSNVSVVVARQTDDSIVSSGFTDSSGGIKFDLSSRIAYNVYFFKGGFDNLTGTLRVADTSYTFTMLQSNTSDVSRYAGINVVFSPTSTLLDNNSVYNLSGSFTSAVFNVSNFAFYLYDGLYLVDDSVSLVGSGVGAFTTIDGSYSIVDFNTSVISTFMTARLVLQLDDNSNISYYKIYSINSIYEGDASISKMFTRIGSFDKAGFENADRFFWTLLVIIAITFSVAGIGGFVGDEEKVLLLITLLVGIGSWAGFMDLEFAPVNEGWILFVLIGVATLFVYIKKWRDK